MENKSMALLLGAFIALIIGVSLIGVIATQGQAVTTKLSASAETTDLSTSCYAGALFQVNESLAACNITATYAPTSWKVEECPVTSVVVTNATGTALTVNTDYVVYASTGIIQMLNTTATASAGLGNESIVTYSYCGDDYLTEGWTRSISGLIPGFFAMALLLMSVGMFYQVMKNEGLLGM